MNIPTSKYLKNKARRRLQEGQEPKKVLLYYIGISLLAAVLATGIRLALGNQISQTGGLRNLGLRSILTTADSVIPIFQSVLLLGLELGYLFAMLRIARRQYASPNTLKRGAERFWPLLRLRIMVGLQLMAAMLLSFYLAMALFLFSPFVSPLEELVQTLVVDGVFQADLMLDDPAMMNQVMDATLPMMILFGIAALVLMLPIVYRYRFADFILADRSGCGASYAMRQSAVLMHGNFKNMFLLDLSWWWYYLLRFAASGLVYGDILLGLLGFDVGDMSIVFFGLYLIADCTITWFFKNHVTVSYALAYDAVMPKEKPQEIVLGNIFDMAKDMQGD